jgi:hypothetical protein
MIRDARLLSNRKPCNLGIFTASNQTIPANGKGDLAMSTRNTLIKFNDVVACEHLTHNIISISQLAAKGHTVLFDESGGYVIREANAHVLQGLKKTAFIKAIKEDGLYITKINHVEANQIKINNVSRMTWHRRMGHLNFSDMDRLNNLTTGYSVGDKEEEDCLPCILSKSKRKSYKRSSNRASRPGEIFDVGVINEESFQGFKYYILFVDDYSRYSILFPLKRKSESEDYIKHHLSRQCS